MRFLTNLYVRAQESQKGQTMAEYALILAAVGVIVYVSYQTLGTSISTLLASVDAAL